MVGLGGTMRPGSSTERVLRVALDAAAAAGARTLLLGAADLDLPMYAPQSAYRSRAARRLVDELGRADGVIIASPGYHGAPSGLIKNALDYAEDLRDADAPYLDGRAVGCIACASGWQAAATTLTALRAVAHALRGWPTPLGVTINSATGAFATDGALTDGTERDRLELVGRQVVEFARQRALAFNGM
ncbi:MAG TPA: NAD(P)H-dependent oxidoreductase [Streptosporangiaceae bacterium]